MKNFERANHAIANAERAMNTRSAVGELRPVRGRSARAAWHERGWASTKEFATAINRSLRTVQFWCAKGTVPTERDGGDHQIPVAYIYDRYPHLKPAA